MKTTCEDRISKIHLLVEGELGPQEAEDLREHVEHCSRCSPRLEELSEMKSVLEESFSARISLPPEDITTSRAIETALEKRSSGAVRRFFKMALIGAAACVAVVVISIAVFLRVYFDKTFPDEITGTVMRVSDGVLARDDADADWAPLRPARRLKRGTLIAMPEKVGAIVVFDGVRILGDGRAEIKIEGRRRFSLEKGAVHVAAADKRKPLRISLGGKSLQTNDSTLRLDVAGGSTIVDCILGSATLKAPGVGKRCIAPGQRVSVTGERIQVAAISVENPFKLAKESVLERIKKRFDKVMLQYAHMSPSAPGRKSMGRAVGADEGWRFASYAQGEPTRYARGRSESSVADYYDKMFSPSARTITVGRQKVIPVTPGWMPSQPSWSHDGSMISFIESRPYTYGGRLRIVSLDDLDNPWDISQEYEGLVIQMLPAVWAPDNRHVIFTAMNDDPMGFNQNYELKIAPIDPSEGPIRDFNSPFFDIPLPLSIPIGKNFSANIQTLPWGDAMLVGNWGNLGYIPVEPDGQAVAGASGFFLTNFNPRRFFSTGGGWSASGSMISFTAISDLQVNPFEHYILFETEDILDGFTQPPRSRDDPRIKQLAPSGNFQFGSGFSYDESLVFFHEDVNGAFNVMFPIDIFDSDFDLFYANALPGEPSRPTQIHMPGNQMSMSVSPEGNRLIYCNYEDDKMELRVVSFDIEADMDMDLGGVLIDNSGSNLIVPPGALEENFAVTISTPFSIGEETDFAEDASAEDESIFFAMRLIDAEGLENPRFIEPMTLTIRYTDEEVEGLDEGMLDIYYYDESDPDNPVWIGLGGVVDPEHNEITVEIQHFSKFSVGGKKPEQGVEG